MPPEVNPLWRHVGRLGATDAPRAARLLYAAYRNGFKLGHRLLFDHDRTYVYEADWDVLVVIDACRVDLLRAVEDGYDFVGEWRTVESAGSSSIEWLCENFSDDYVGEMARTAHVTGNVKTNVALDPADFLRLDEVWRYAWSEDLGTVPPRPVTDRAIRTWRELAPERMVVHYMQPHFPSVTHPELGSRAARDGAGGHWETTSIWDRLRRGSVGLEEVWAAYRGNLEAVLEDVELLLTSIDAERVVVTSDHGNAVGEYGFVDHPGYHPLSVLREVPWCVTAATDDSGYEPELERRDASVTDDGVQERLASLGYA